jgi:medium-chain acyl-[acyl-carrier-protein] hydrolase
MTTNGASESAVWFAGRLPRPTARFRVFCFPYAGLGASLFQSWIGALGDDVDICPVQLPGRESRNEETPFRRIDPLVEATARALQPYVDIPFALFGHNFGATIAFELARRFRTHPLLNRLFVSARRAPHLPDPLSGITHLPDNAFVDEVQCRYAGIPHGVLAYPDLLAALLPRVRADFEIVETYRFRPAESLGCAISAFGGRFDPTVREPALRAWQAHTVAGVRVRMVDGGHLFLQDRRKALLEAIDQDLRLPSAVPARIAV